MADSTNTSSSNSFSQTNEQLRANLYAFEEDSSVALYDGNLTMYNINNSNDLNKNDVVKMSNFGENFGLLRGNTTLVVERRQSIITTDTVFFKMWNMREVTYKFELMLTGLNRPGLTAVLEDLYLNTKTNLDLNGKTDFIFTITGEEGSSNSDRFRIIFAIPLRVSPLPQSFDITNISHNLNKVYIVWKLENNNKLKQFEVEKSADGSCFIKAGTVSAANSIGNQDHYYWSDANAVSGSSYYRVRSIGVNGEILYSNIAQVNSSKRTQAISIFPNPINNGTITIRLHNQPGGDYVFRLKNKLGQVLITKKVQHYTGNSTQFIPVNKKLPRGIYYLETTKPDNNTTAIAVIQ